MSEEKTSLVLFQVNLTKRVRGVAVEGIERIVGATTPSDAMSFIKHTLPPDVRVESAEAVDGVLCSDGSKRSVSIGDEINPEAMFLEVTEFQMREIAEKVGKRYKLVEVLADGKEEVLLDSM